MEFLLRWCIIYQSWLMRIRFRSIMFVVKSINDSNQPLKRVCWFGAPSTTSATCFVSTVLISHKMDRATTQCSKKRRISAIRTQIFVELNLDIKNIVVILVNKTQLPFIENLLIWYHELFDIVNKKGLTDLFATLRFEVLIGIGTYIIHLMYFLKKIAFFTYL